MFQLFLFSYQEKQSVLSKKASQRQLFNLNLSIFFPLHLKLDILILKVQ